MDVGNDTAGVNVTVTPSLVLIDEDRDRLGSGELYIYNGFKEQINYRSLHISINVQLHFYNNILDTFRKIVPVLNLLPF